MPRVWFRFGAALLVAALALVPGGRAAASPGWELSLRASYIPNDGRAWFSLPHHAAVAACRPLGDRLGLLITTAYASR